MQMYDNKLKEPNFWKEILLEFIDFFRAKVESDSLTLGEMQSVARCFMEKLDLYATIDELSVHYDKSKDAVNGIIKRKMTQRPRRNVVLYSFSAFRKIIPESWRKKR